MLPPGWAEASIAEIAGPNGIVSDGDWVESKDQDPSGEVRLIQLADIGVGAFRDRSRRYMTAQAADRLRCTTLQAGDVLVARMPDPIGRACVFPGLNQRAVTAVDVMICRLDGTVGLPDWLTRWMNTPHIGAVVAQAAGGTTRQRVSGGALKRLQLPLPPLPEQRRIVAKLDDLTARLARARAELHRTLELPQRLRTEALRLAFANIQNHAPLRSLTQFVTSGSRGWAKFYADEGPVFIRVGDVRRLDVRLDLSDVQCVQPPPSAEGARTSVRTSDVVVTITADLGRVGVVPEGVCGYVNQHVALARPIDPASGRWIAWYLASEMGQTQMLTKDRGVTKAGLGLDDIRDVRIPVVDARQRDDIVTEIEVRFARADRLDAEAKKALALIDRLEAAILTKAFRGELVAQDPNDEPASVLLERIRARRAAEPKVKRGRRPKLAS